MGLAGREGASLSFSVFWEIAEPLPFLGDGLEAAFAARQLGWVMRSFLRRMVGWIVGVWCRLVFHIPQVPG